MFAFTHVSAHHVTLSHEWFSLESKCRTTSLVMTVRAVIGLIGLDGVLCLHDNWPETKS